MSQNALRKLLGITMALALGGAATASLAQYNSDDRLYPDNQNVQVPVPEPQEASPPYTQDNTMPPSRPRGPMGRMGYMPDQGGRDRIGALQQQEGLLATLQSLVPEAHGLPANRTYTR